ncbi:MAG: hypothetical protein WC858_03820 [Parcubacteria group bacterium]|jgi:Tfp pilus assembly protein PilO
MNRFADKKILLIIIAIIVVLASLGWLTFFYQAKKIRDTAAGIQKEKLDWQVQKEKSQKISQLKKSLGDLETHKNDMEGFYADKNNALPLIKSLEAIAGETGNEITITVADLSKLASAQKKTVPKDSDEDAATAKKDSAATKDSNTKSTASAQNFKNNLGFNLELSGTYPQLVNFLIKMENLPYFVRIYNYSVDAFIKNKPSSSSNQSSNSGASGEIPEGKLVKSNILIMVYTNGQ